MMSSSAMRHTTGENLERQVSRNPFPGGKASEKIRSQNAVGAQMFFAWSISSRSTTSPIDLFNDAILGAFNS